LQAGDSRFSEFPIFFGNFGAELPEKTIGNQQPFRLRRYENAYYHPYSVEDQDSADRKLDKAAFQNIYLFRKLRPAVPGE
jgi:hypothetical protein